MLGFMSDRLYWFSYGLDRLNRFFLGYFGDNNFFFNFCAIFMHLGLFSSCDDNWRLLYGFLSRSRVNLSLDGGT